MKADTVVMQEHVEQLKMEIRILKNASEKL